MTFCDSENHSSTEHLQAKWNTTGNLLLNETSVNKENGKTVNKW